MTTFAHYTDPDFADVDDLARDDDVRDDLAGFHIERQFTVIDDGTWISPRDIQRAFDIDGNGIDDPATYARTSFGRFARSLPR